MDSFDKMKETGTIPPVLFSSGFYDSSVQNKIKMLPNTDMIEKPFEIDTLLQTSVKLLKNSKDTD